MSRASSDDDFSAPDSAADAEPSPLRRLVLDQLEEPGGAAVLIGSPWAPDPLSDLADTPAAYGPEAYLLQSELGGRLLAAAGPPAGTPVLACNYHDIPTANRPAVEERLRRLRDLGPVLDPDDGQAPDGPRIVVGFYDSYREAGLFGADLCHRLGLRAWFFPLFEATADEPDTAALSDAELADIATVHELGFHTASHTRVEAVTEANLDREVRGTHERLSTIAGRPPRLGAWLGGSRWDARHLGNRVLRDLGVAHLVSNWSVETVPRGTAGPCAPPAEGS